MTLNEYMIWKGLTDADMAVLLSVDRVSVTRYRNGRRRPRWEIAALIKHVSNGMVPADSWLPPIKLGRKRPRQ